MLEQQFGEERLRNEVIPHAFGERTAMKLLLAALFRASQTWRSRNYSSLRAQPMVFCE